MSRLDEYAIPPIIQNLEFNGDKSSLSCFEEKIRETRTNQKAYIDAFTALIHMEEAANSTHLTAYDFKYVEIELHSRISKLFKVNHANYGGNIQNYYKAWEKGTIDAFTVIPIASHLNITISGQISKVDSQYIYLKVVDGFSDLLYCQKNDGQHFNVFFNINRTVYQLQHNALKWFEKHNLFSLLIENPRYDGTFCLKPECGYKYVYCYKKLLNCQLFNY